VAAVAWAGSGYHLLQLTRTLERGTPLALRARLRLLPLGARDGELLLELSEDRVEELLLETMGRA